MKKKNKVTYYLIYSLLFSLLAGLVVYFYYSQGKSLIEADGDGFRQHFRAVVYYSDYLKQIISTFFTTGKLIIPQWDFVIGEGSDVLTSLHYYCIGDIFTFFSFLCPRRYMYIYFDGATIARMFFSGIAFSELCFYKKKNNWYIVLSAALLYAFCPLSLSNLGGHVFFLSAVVYLPLIILGVERVINNDTPYLLSFSVFLSAISNIYFFYMNVLSTVIYTVIRLIFIDSDFKEKFNILIKIALYSFVGVMLSSFIFLPMFNTMISNTRLETKIATDLFYSKADYIGFYTWMSFNGYMHFGGFTLLGMISLVELFKRRSNKTLLVLFVIALVFNCFPFFGKLYNAMVYPTDRWLYAVSLLVCYIVVDTLDDLKEISSDYLLCIIILSFYYISCAFIDGEKLKIHIMFFILTIVSLIFFRLINNKKLCSLMCVGIAVFSIFFDIMFLYSPMFWFRSEGGMPIEEINKMPEDEYSVFNEINDETFFRYSGNSLTTNQSIHGDKSSTQYYWSVVNDYVVNFRKDIGLSDNSNHHISNYDDRFILNSLAGVKYYIHSADGLIPYGYSFYKTINNYDVYITDKSMPLIYGYDNYLDYSEWLSLSLSQRSESLTQSAVINKKIDKINKTDNIEFESKEIDAKMSNSTGLTLKDGLIIVEQPQSSIYLECNSNESGEYYFVIEGLSSEESAYIGVKYNDVFKTLKYKGTKNLHYSNRHDYMINLGYMEGIDGTIEISFPVSGNFQYSSIKVVCQPLGKQINYLERLKSVDFSEYEVSNGQIKTRISIDDNKLICLSVPYSKGWKAFVDGKETELLNCNVQYMGFILEKGTHEIELKYTTPLSNFGLIISISGATVLSVLWLRNRKYNRISKNEKK